MNAELLEYCKKEIQTLLESKKVLQKDVQNLVSK